MKKLILFMLTFIICISAISVLRGETEDFSIEKYLLSLNNFPERPPFPEMNFGGANFFESMANGFETVVNFLAYPFKYITYLYECAEIIVGGLIEW